MRFTIVMVVVLLAGVSMTSAKPLILTKKFLRYVLPTVTAKVAGLSGLSGLTGLTGLTGLSGSRHLGAVSGGRTKESIGSVYLPNRVYSFLFPRDSINPPPSVVYHSLEDYCAPDPFVPSPVPVPAPYGVPVAYPAPVPFASGLPAPLPAPAPVGVSQEWEESSAHASANANIAPAHPPVYVAETPAVRHEAPLPGYTGSVFSTNTAPAPGTAPF
ncbi:nematocyst expressed protein 3-like [Armigeres subalbatus]|uniref:nematocyst expressed protein 3-like n=1 Tax=Armigeres subalbatus TaxID=124917 RepID=UPI002ED133CC